MADSFMERSKKDLIICKDAWHEKDYSEATYKLQQAGEKGTKAFLLYTGYADYKELRKECTAH